MPEQRLKQHDSSFSMLSHLFLTGILGWKERQLLDVFYRFLRCTKFSYFEITESSPRNFYYFVNPNLGSFFPFSLFPLSFLDKRKEGMERETETSMWERHTDWLPPAPGQVSGGSNLQPFSAEANALRSPLEHWLFAQNFKNKKALATDLVKKN